MFYKFEDLNIVLMAISCITFDREISAREIMFCCVVDDLKRWWFTNNFLSYSLRLDITVERIMKRLIY